MKYHCSNTRAELQAPRVIPTADLSLEEAAFLLDYDFVKERQRTFFTHLHHFASTLIYSIQYSKVYGLHQPTGQQAAINADPSMILLFS